MKKQKPYWEMNAKELARATREYDAERVEVASAVISKQERARHARVLAKVKRRAGRPCVGRGVRRVLITVERGLLDRADSYAKSHSLSRSQLIARGLLAVMHGAA